MLGGLGSTAQLAVVIKAKDKADRIALTLSYDDSIKQLKQDINNLEQVYELVESRQSNFKGGENADNPGE